MQQPNNKLNLLSQNTLLLLFLYFALGLISGLNSLLTPLFKNLFQTNYFLSNLVPFAFFSACFLGSIFYVCGSKIRFYFLQQLSYKGLILFGLSFACFGCLIFVPASIIKSYSLFLCGLFIIGIGFTFIQISLTPLLSSSGNLQAAAARLNLAGGINSLATTLAPILGVLLFYKVFHVETNSQNLEFPYLFLAFCLGMLGLLVWNCFRFNETNLSVKPVMNTLHALSSKRLRYGMLAIFLYVGAEVSIGNNLITYLELPTTVNLSYVASSKLLVFYWAGAMIGRFLSFIMFTSWNIMCKVVAMVFLAATLIYYINLISGEIDLNIQWYWLFNVILIAIFIIARRQVQLSLILCASVAIINLICITTFQHNQLVAWALIAIGLFNSIMWPNILTIALEGLTDYRKQGSALLMMMVFGGAVIPLVLGIVADFTNITNAFLILIISYVYIGCYGLFYNRI